MDRTGIVLDVDAAGLGQARFAVAPAHEVVQAFRVLRAPAPPAVHRPWARRAAPKVAGLDLSDLDAVVTERGYTPDFISPPPRAADGTFAAALAHVRRTPPGQVAAELGMAAAGAGPARAARLAELARRPARARDALADNLEALWQRVVEPDWPALHRVLHADVLHRARRVAAGGLAAVLPDLHPTLRWTGGSLRVDHHYAHRARLARTGLLLVPSVFGWPSVQAVLDPPWQQTLCYPARGIATLWAGATATPPAPLATLLGSGRARVLAVLAEPTGTLEAARRAGLAPATAWEHLTVLRAAGLLVTHRYGSGVLHQRTALGDALAESAHDGKFDGRCR